MRWFGCKLKNLLWSSRQPYASHLMCHTPHLCVCVSSCTSLNKIIIQKNSRVFDPHKFFTAYLHVQVENLPLSSLLWLTSKGTVSTRSFFIKRLHRFFQHRHCRSILMGRRCNITCRKWSPSIYHPSHWQMGFRQLQDLHSEEPCPNPGTSLWTVNAVPIFLHPCSGTLTFYLLLQTFIFCSQTITTYQAWTSSPSIQARMYFLPYLFQSLLTSFTM